MKNPNPIIPPGMDLDKSNRGRSNMRIAVVVIVMVHIALFGGILFNACSQKDDGAVDNVAPEENKITRNTPPDIPSPVVEGATEVDPLPTVAAPAGGQASDPFSGGGGGDDLLLPAAVGTDLSSSTASDAGTDVTSDFPPLPPAVGVGEAIGSAVASSSTAAIEHSVLSGEHFTSLAKKYKVSVRAIQNANPTLDSRHLQIGQKVKIPAPAAPVSESAAATLVADEYIIKRGDSLSTIAQRHETSVKALREANNLTTDLILAGEKLKLPPGSKFSQPASSIGAGGFTTPPPGTE